MSTVAVLQLSRMGDIIQTLLAAKDFKKIHPQKKLIFIGRKSFAHPLHFLISSYFDHIIYLDKEEIFSLPLDLKSCKAAIKNFVASIDQYQIDQLINLTFSDTSSYLTALIQAKEKKGLNRDSDLSLVINDHWSQYVFSNLMCGPYCPFNLVDIFKFMLGTFNPHGQTDENAHRTNSKTIIIHPFASQIKKRWKVSKWIQVINLLFDSNDEIEIKIVGSKNEREEANSIVRGINSPPNSARIKNICGEVSLEELVTEIKTARFFIGHDSMIGHLASLLSVPTLTLSMGTVRPHETGPYPINNDCIHYNLVANTSCFPCYPDTPCSFHICQNDLPSKSVVKLIQHLFNNKQISALDLQDEDIAPFLGKFSIFSTAKSNNLLYLKNLDDSYLNLPDLFRHFFFIIWSFVLEEIDVAPNIKLRIKNDDYKILQEYLNALKQLDHLYHFGEQFANKLLTEISQEKLNINLVQDLSKKIAEVDQLALQLKDNFPYLTPIINYHYVASSNIRGQSIAEQVTYTLLSYRERIYTLQILKDFIEQIFHTNKTETTENKGSERSEETRGESP